MVELLPKFLNVLDCGGGGEKTSMQNFKPELFSEA